MKATTQTRLARLEANMVEPATTTDTIPTQLVDENGRVVKTIPARPMAIGAPFDYRDVLAELEL